MNRPRVRRCLTLLICLVTGLATSGAAAAHGWAHAHESEHHDEDRGHARAVVGGSADGRHARVEPEHDEADHPHPELASVTVKSRSDGGAVSWAPGPRPDPLMLDANPPRRVAVDYAARPRADPSRSLPPPSRAPPLG